MTERPLIQRGLMRRALRNQLRRGKEEDNAMIRLALDDEAVFETTYETAMQEAKRFGDETKAFSIAESMPGGQGERELLVDNLLKLLQWFVANGPELVKIITIIVGLFGGTQFIQAICDDETIYIE